MRDRSCYKIGHLNLWLDLPKDMPRPQNLEKFRVPESEGGAHDLPEPVGYELQYTDRIGEIAAGMRKRKQGTLDVCREALEVFGTDCGECRMIRFAGAERPYGISLEQSEGLYQIWVDREIGQLLSSDTVFASLLSLEKHMIKHGAMILHSAFMCRGESAVLFSAASGVGKSTQADLWEMHRGTYTVNGDRSLLIREPSGWYACGGPVCGSSGICRNECWPVKAIVMLKQAGENRIRPLKGLAAVRLLMEQITVNTWDSGFQMRVMDELERLIEEIPVYELECDISEDAVICLEQALDGR